MLRRISYFILGIMLGAVAMIFWASNADAVEYSPNGTSGLNLVYNGNDDDNSYTVNLPWTINFLGTNYNSVYVGTNGYITFSSPNSTYSGFSASNPAGPHISIYPADRRLYKLYYAELAAGTAQARFVIRAEGVDYSNAAITHIWEVHFYPGTSYFDIYFVDAPSSGNAGTTGISNGFTYVSTFTTTELTGIRINANGTLDVGAPVYSSSITNAQQSRVYAFRARTSSEAGIHIEQIGDNNTITIVQKGRSSIMGIGQDKALIDGDGNNITIRQGVDATGNNEIKLRVVGNTNTLNLNQSNTTQGTAIGGNGHYLYTDIYGNLNTLTTQQSNTGGVGGHYAETTISGNSNNVTKLQTGNGNKIMFTNVVGSNNTVTATQKDTGQHYLDLKLMGNGHNANIVQEGSASHRATIDLTNAGGSSSVILNQNSNTTPQVYSIQQSCANAAGCSATVTQNQ
jgi:hypothetical protein